MQILFIPIYLPTFNLSIFATKTYPSQNYVILIVKCQILYSHHAMQNSNNQGIPQSPTIRETESKTTKHNQNDSQ